MAILVREFGVLLSQQSNTEVDMKRLFYSWILADFFSFCFTSQQVVCLGYILRSAEIVVQWLRMQVWGSEKIFRFDALDRSFWPSRTSRTSRSVSARNSLLLSAAVQLRWSLLTFKVCDFDSMSELGCPVGFPNGTCRLYPLIVWQFAMVWDGFPSNVGKIISQTIPQSSPHVYGWYFYDSHPWVVCDIVWKTY